MRRIVEDFYIEKNSREIIRDLVVSKEKIANVVVNKIELHQIILYLDARGNYCIFVERVVLPRSSFFE